MKLLLLFIIENLFKHDKIMSIGLYKYKGQTGTIIIITDLQDCRVEAGLNCRNTCLLLS